MRAVTRLRALAQPSIEQIAGVPSTNYFRISAKVVDDWEGEAPAEPRSRGKLNDQTARQEPRPPDSTRMAQNQKTNAATEFHGRNTEKKGREFLLPLFRVSSVKFRGYEFVLM